MRLLFGGERYTAELSWTDLSPLLPGWEIISCPPAAVPEHLAGADAICPVGARIDAGVLEAGSFGLVHQFGVGLYGWTWRARASAASGSRACPATGAATPTASPS